MILRIALTLAIQLAATAAFAGPAVIWKPLQPGVELATIPPGPLYVVRIDPTRATVAAGIASEEKATENRHRKRDRSAPRGVPRDLRYNPDLS